MERHLAVLRQRLAASAPAAPNATSIPVALPLASRLTARLALPDALRGQRGLIALEIAMLAVYFVVKSLPIPVLLPVWAAVAALLAFASPATGLVLLAAIAPFNEANVYRELIVKAPLGLALAVSVGVRYLLGARPPIPALPIQLGLLLLGVTASSLLHTFARYGASVGLDAARIWVSGVGSGLVVLAISAWVAGMGDRRPFLVALGTLWVAAALGLVDWANRDLLRDGPIGWMFRPEGNGSRLTGVVPGPNPMATLLLIPVCVLAAIALLGTGWRTRAAALAAGVVPSVALILTYSRSSLIALVVAGLLLVARLPRRFAIAAVVLGAAGLVGARQALIAVRRDIDAGLPVSTGDDDRAGAWGASIRMFIEEPITGIGFHGYRHQHAAFGEAVTNAPHNEWLRWFAENGAFAGVLGLAFVLASIVVIGRGRGPVSAGLAAATAAAWVMATFNNPLTYMQVTTPLFLAIGAGVALAPRREPVSAPGTIPRSTLVARRLLARLVAGQRAAVPAGLAWARGTAGATRDTRMRDRVRAMLAWPPAVPLMLLAATPLLPAYRVTPGLSLDDLPPLAGIVLLLRVIGLRALARIRYPRIAGLGLVLLALAGFASAAANAQDAPALLEMIVRGPARLVFVGLIAAAVAATIPADVRQRVVAVALAAIGTFEGAFGLWAYVIGFPGRFGLSRHASGSVIRDDAVGRVIGTLGISSNFLGAVFVLTIPITAALALLALVALVVLARRPIVLLPMGVGFAALAVLTPIVERFADYQHRAALWYTALRMMAESPLVGVGVGRMAPMVRGDPERWRATPFGPAVSNAHNTILLAAAETGVVGAIGALLLNVGLVLLCLAVIRRNLRGATSRLPTAAAVAVLAFLVQGMTNNLFSVAVTVTVLAIVVGAFLLDRAEPAEARDGAGSAAGG